jgi:hypothetical protein
MLQCLGEVGTELSNDRIRDKASSFDRRDQAIRRDPVTDAFQHYHLSVEIDKCANTEIAMAQEPRNSD